MNQKQIRFTDVTLYQSTQHAYSFKQRVELAKTLDRLGVDTIRLFPIVSEKADTFAIRTVAAVVANSVLSVPVAPSEASIDAAWNAARVAAHPELYVHLPVSVVQMEYFYQKKPEKMLEVITSAISYAKTKTDAVHFAAEDATRADLPYLAQAVQCALDAGATAITLCDDAATMFGADYAQLLSALYEAVPALCGVCVSVQCNDALSLACANALGALQAGANGIAVSVGQDCNVCSLPAMAQILRVKGDDLGFTCQLRLTELQHSLKQLQLLTADATSQVRGAVSADEMTLTDADDITAVSAAVRELGYDLSEEDLTKVYDSFLSIAKKKSVTAKELDAIVATAALQVPPTYRLLHFVINSGNNITATACVELERDGQAYSAVCAGHGPIDAAFLAIDTILGHHYELDDFQIQSVTQGSEAMGSALVRLRADGKLYSGSGISTDIIGASIRAYLGAINKIAYEEKA